MSSNSDEKRQPRRLRPWTALPQGFLRRPEVMRLSKEAKLLFWAMTDHACEQLTDGVIQDVELPLLYAVTGSDGTAFGELTKARIVGRLGSSYQLSDFLEYSRSREDREAARANGRNRVAKHRRGATANPPPPHPVTRYETRSVAPPVTRPVLSTEGEVEGEKDLETVMRGPILNKGDFVFHPGYGLGELLNVDGGETSVRFETVGVKRIYASFLVPAPTPSTLSMPNSPNGS